MLVDLRFHVQKGLVLLEQQIILSRTDDDEEEFDFLLKKAIHLRDTLAKIDQRLNEL